MVCSQPRQPQQAGAKGPARRKLRTINRDVGMATIPAGVMYFGPSWHGGSGSKGSLMGASGGGGAANKRERVPAPHAGCSMATSA